MSVVFIIISSITFFCGTYGKVNLYISNTEMRRISGFDAELFYIRDGVENTNAVRHQLLVSETVDHVTFRWRDTSSSWPSLLASSSVSTQHVHVVPSPSLSLPSHANIPLVEEEFQVRMKCQTGVDGSSLVHFQLNISNIHKEATSGFSRAAELNFWFNKLCMVVNIVNDDTNDSDRELIYNDIDTSDSQSGDNMVYVSFALLYTAVVALAGAIGFLHVHSMPRAKEEESVDLLPSGEPKEEEPAPKVVPKGLLAAIAEERQKEIMLMLSDFVVRRNLLSIGNTVQEGTFGRAYLGTLVNAEHGEEMKVLVKTVTDQILPEQKTVFLAECCQLKRVTHHNVLPLMNVCFEEGKPPLAIYKYMNRGNMKNFLRLSRTAAPLLKAITTRDIVLIALQVARGLQHLARRHIVHKDVATRNCVIDEELHVKVCDKALARDFFPGDYHCLGDNNESRPIRWMAAECLESGQYQYLSDVWSYGVLLWELCSLAQTPYANVDPFEMLTYLQSGLRLPQPHNCPDDLFTVMACCWALSPEDRPHFTQIIACLDAFLNKLNAFI